jgi:hypothetical protein
MSMLFWVVTQCGLVGRYKRFEEKYCSHLQDTVSRSATMLVLLK